MTYQEIIKYLESFINYEKLSEWPYKKSLKLERIKDFLAMIGNPQNGLRCIHIAGSKGKGSTCAFIAYILRDAGYTAGLYTSPHLSDFRERIRILFPRPEHRAPSTEFEGMISKKELAALVERLKPAIENYNKNSEYGPLSFFEIYTALAFVYFKEKKVDFVVLETGLGGRLDATNVVNAPICVITSISYEHADKLGNTLAKIAREKAGIIKSGFGIRDSGFGRDPNTENLEPIVVTAPQEKEALGVIRQKCRQTNAKLYEIGGNILYKKIKNGFNVNGMLGRYLNLKINLLGKHQQMNASTAIATIEALSFWGINIGIDSIRQGLYNTVWPGRCEVVSRKPAVVLDGAQNAASARILKEVIKEKFQYKKLILILGISDDKDIKGICKEICPLANTIILTQADNPRAAGVNIIGKNIREPRTENREPIIKTKTVKEAITEAKNIAKKQDLILVTGSLFVVGEARELFK